MPAPALLALAGLLGIGGGVCLIADSLAVDLFGVEAAGPNTLGVLVPVLGSFLIVGLFAVVRGAAPSRLLDWGFALNLIGLILVTGIDFTRTYVFSNLDDDTVDALLENGPTKPAFIVAGAVFVVGAVLFGAALIRAGHAPAASWLYTLTAVPSGLVFLLPDAVGAVAQAAAGLAVVVLGRSLRESAHTTVPAPIG